MEIGKIEIREITPDAIRKLEPKLLQLAEKLTSIRLDENNLLRAGTSGFRGKCDERLARNIAAYSVALGECLGQAKTVTIGYDERPGSQLNALLCAAILKRIGLQTEITKTSVTISCLAKMVLESKKKHVIREFYGVMCGASHNPLTDNGMNFIMPDGSIAEEDFTNELAERVLKVGFRPSSRAMVEQVEIQVVDPTRDYVDSIVEFVGEIDRKDVVVVADPLNGAGKKALPDLVKALGVTCYVVEREGFEGMRDLDPRNNVGSIKEGMKKRNADLGVLIDGDGDRALFVYPRAEVSGAIVEEADFNEAFAAILDHLVRSMPVYAVSTNVASSSIFRDICKTHGINIYDKNPVGFKHQSRDMRQHPDKVIVGIEGNSGGFTVSSFSHEKDGCLAAALAVKMVAETGNFADSIDRLRKKYGRRYAKEINVSTPDLPTREDRRSVIDSLEKDFKIGLMFCGKEITEVITVDGIKLKFGDDSSLLIRASGTEPMFRVVPETKTKKEVEILGEAGRKMLGV